MTDKLIQIFLDLAQENKAILPNAFLHPEEFDKEWLGCIKEGALESMKITQEDIVATIRLKERYRDDEEIQEICSDIISLWAGLIKNG